MRKSQVIINLGAWHGGLTLNDISRDRGRGELGRGWSRGRGPLGLSTDIRWRQSQEHQAPVLTTAAFIKTSKQRKLSLPGFTRLAALSQYVQGSLWTNTALVTDIPLLGRRNHFTSLLHCSWSRAPQVKCWWCRGVLLHVYITSPGHNYWTDVPALSLWVTQNWIVQNTSRWDLSGVHPQTNTITSPPPAATGWSQNKVKILNVFKVNNNPQKLNQRSF